MIPTKPLFPSNRLSSALRHYYAPIGIACLTAGILTQTAKGFDASFELSRLDGVNGFTIGLRGADQAGWSVSDAGDINNDGINDVIIGAPYSNANGLNSGRSYVVFGRSGNFAVELTLSALDGNNGFAINGIDALDYAGAAVSEAGDINGDGLDDLIIGAPLSDPVNDDAMVKAS